MKIANFQSCWCESDSSISNMIGNSNHQTNLVMNDNGLYIDVCTECYEAYIRNLIERHNLPNVMGFEEMRAADKPVPKLHA